MSGEPDEPNEFRNAQEAYAAFVREQQTGKDVTFEAFCARHPKFADDLKKLDAGYRLGRSASLSQSFHDSMRDHFGDDVSEVTVALTADGNAEVTADFSSGDAAELKSAKPTKPTKLDEGQDFGRYDVEDEVARGGMGAIYRVKDRDLSRTLALKVMLSSPGGTGTGTSPDATRASLARFVEEAQVTAQLDHPGIVPVHELGFDAQGRVYFTMKLVKGRELGEIFALARGEKEDWNLSRAVGVMVKACQALAYAHAKQVVHRDLKPANIMTGRFGEVYVMDWGLAKVAGKKDLHDIRLQNTTEMTYTSIRSDRKSAAESSAESPLITMDGSVVGTPAYMPPEQAGGKVEEVDSSSDIYSLGAILYNLLTGQAPYVEPGTRISPHTILARVLDRGPKRVHELSPQAPPELVAICEKAMARDKKRRYKSSLDMAEDLQAYLDHRVVRAYRTGAIAEFKSWVTRNKGMAASAAAAAVLAMCGLVAVFVVQLEARRHIQEERDIALEARGREEEAKTLAQNALEQVTAERDLKNEALEEKTTALAEKDSALAQAEGLFLSGQASQEIATNPGRALLLAVEGAERQVDVTNLTNQILLDALTADRELRVIAGSGQSVSEVAYSPDGELIATVQDGGIRLSDVASGETISLFLDPGGSVLRSPRFSADGRRLAAMGRYPAHALVFDVASRRLLSVLEGHLSSPIVASLQSIAFSPDGTKLVTSSLRTARVHDASTGLLISELRGHLCAVQSATFSPDSARVLTASMGWIVTVTTTSSSGRGVGRPTNARVWNAATGEEVLRIGRHRRTVSAAAFSPDGQRILTCSDLGLTLTDAATGDEIAVPDRPERSIHALWSPEGDLITLSSDGSLRRWSSDPVSEIWSAATSYTPEDPPPAPRISQDGRFLALLEDVTSVGLRDARSGRLLKTFRGHVGPVNSFAFSPDGRRLITGSDDGTTRVWDTAPESRLGDLRPVAHYKNAKTVLFDPGGRRVLMIEKDESVSVTERVSGRSLHRLSRPKAGGLRLFQRELIEAAYFRPGANEVATVTRAGALRFWDLEDESRRPSMVPVLVGDIDFDPTGEYVAVLGMAGAVQVLRYGDSNFLKKFWENNVLFARPRFSPDGKTLLALGSDVSARLWAIPSGEELERIDLKQIFPQMASGRSATANASQETPPDALFDPTGKRWLLSLRGGLALLDGTSGSRIGELDGRWADFADHVEFAPDGESILVVAGGRIFVTDRDLAAAPRDIGEPRTVYRGASFNREGDRMAALTNSGTVEIRDGPTANLLYRLGEPSRVVRSVAFRPGPSEPQRLLTGSMDGKLDLWDLSSGRHVQSFGEHPEGVSMVSFSPGGKTVLSVSDGLAHLWEAEGGKQLRTLTRSELSLRAQVESWASGGSTRYAFSKDGRRFMMSLPGRAKAAVWDVESGELLLQHRRDRTNFTAATLGPKGDHLFLSRQDWQAGQFGSLATAHERLGATIASSEGRTSRIEMIEVRSGRGVGVFRAAESSRLGGPIISATIPWKKMVVSADGRLLAATVWNVLVVWEISTRAELFRSRVSDEFLEFSPDGRRLMHRDSSGLRMWDSESGDVQNLPEVPTSVRSLTFSPDGGYFLTTDDGSDVRVWFHRAVTALRGHLGPVTSAVFSPDGRWIATSSEDRTVRVWSAETGSHWLTFPHTGRIISVLFSHDGSEVLTVTADQRPHAWPLDVLTRAKTELKRSLTIEERTVFRIGSENELDQQRQDETIKRICEELRRVAGVLRRDPANGGGRARCNRLMDELSGVTSTLGDKAARYFTEIDQTIRVYQDLGVALPSFMEFQAELLATRGDVPGAIGVLERAMRGRLATTKLEAQLESYRESLLPDLATFASIDAALDAREAVVPEGATWRYMKGTQEPSPDLEWTEPSFDDRGWKNGPSGFGYGDGDDTTLLDDMRSSYTTVYVRHAFDRPDVSRFEDFSLSVVADDGFVAYLNGNEIGRSRAGTKGTRLAHDALADSESPEPLESIVLHVPGNSLTAGRNVLALQGLNRSKTSSDLTLIPILEASPEPHLERDRARFEAFRAGAAGPTARTRVSYLEARLIERAGRFGEAIAGFEEIVKEIPSAVDPLLGLVRCLRALRRFDEALAVVTRGFSTRLVRDDELWDTWFELFLVDLGRDVRDALVFLERRQLEGTPGARRARDLRWALERIGDGGLRLNCGGRDHHSVDGAIWATDRFYSRSGLSGLAHIAEIAETEDDALFRSERYFPRSTQHPFGYRIPIPPARYRVTLGLAETFSPRRRRFDVFLEGDKVLESYEPKWVEAETHEFECAVTDGFLDITFEREIDNPKVSTIEVVRVE